MATLIQLRRDSAANWTSTNPILAEGELGLELDTYLYKIGNGVDAWNTLSYAQMGGSYNTVALNTTTDPSSPLSGLLLYAKDVGGRNMPKFIGPSGLDSILQPAIFGNGISIASPATSTALSYFGMGALTAVGTVSHPALASESQRASTRRAILTSAATANSASEFRLSTTQAWRGDTAGLGGFYAVFRFGVSSSVATQRVAVGLWASTSATSTSVEPSTIVNGVWVGNDAADANLQLMYNDASGTASKINLGSDFVKNQVNAVYELTIFARPNDTSISYRVKRLDDVGETSGSVNTDIPATTTFLAPHFYLNNGGTASAVILDFYRYYLESDY